ncbi:MAG: phosphomannose isomerase type II C-terminal cupin domain [Actinomycetes bacterium]
MSLNEAIPRAASQPLPLRDDRPWGHFERFTLNESSTVKIISVDPGQRLSLQVHEHRDEWWHILDPDLVVQLDDESLACAAGDKVWIPRGTAHRVENRGTAPARFLEIAFGEFDETDIERLADDYARSPASSS